MQAQHLQKDQGATWTEGGSRPGWERLCLAGGVKLKVVNRGKMGVEAELPTVEAGESLCYLSPGPGVLSAPHP